MLPDRTRASQAVPPSKYEARPSVSEGFVIPLDTEPMEAKAAERLPAG